MGAYAVYSIYQQGQKAITLTASSVQEVSTEGLVFLKELIEAGKPKAVIDCCYALEQTVEAQ